MEQFDYFLTGFLAFSLIFLTSLYLKYGDKLRKRDAKILNNGKCPIHDHHHNVKNKVKITPNKNDSLNDNDDNNNDEFNQFLLKLKNNPNDEELIEKGMNIADEIVKNAKNCKISTELKLSLYGLFKQSEFGDIDKSEPSKLHYVEYSKWSAWNKNKGKTKLNAKKEYFYLVYNQIVKPFNLNIFLYKGGEGDEEESKGGGGGGTSMSFVVSSKISEQEFDSSIHGDPSELFNKFDLTQSEINENEIISYIETNNISINCQNENGTTFLNFAVDNDKYELSKILIEKFSANINLCDDMGYTPLHSAVINENIQIIKLLLNHGADIYAKSYDDNETPSDLTENVKIKQLLLSSQSTKQD